MKALSHAALDADRVITACQNRIEYIKNKRAELLEESIQKKLEKQSRLSRKVFGPWTREYAKLLIDDSYFPDYKIWGDGSLDVSHRILNLARAASPGPVFVTAEDFRYFRMNYLKDVL